MAIQGLRTTADFVADERPKNYRSAILMLYPNGKAPLTALTSLMKSRTVDDPEYNWWEKEVSNRQVILAASLTVGSTAFQVTAGPKQLKEGDILRAMETGEHMRVAAAGAFHPRRDRNRILVEHDATP